MQSFSKSVLFLAVTFYLVMLSSANKEVISGIIGKSVDVPAKPMNESFASLADLTGYMDECNNTYNIDPSYIDSLNTSGSFPDETDRTPMCFICCMLNEMDVMTPDGVFNQSTAEKYFELQFQENDVSDVIEFCIDDREETDICDRAYMLIRCSMEKLMKK